MVKDFSLAYLQLFFQDYLLFIDFGESQLHLDVQRQQVSESTQGENVDGIFILALKFNEAVEWFAVFIYDIVLVSFLNVSKLKAVILSYSG